MTTLKRIMIAVILTVFTANLNAQTTDEKIEVYELISEYSYMWDAQNIDGLLNLFTDECSWDWYRNDGKEEVLCENKEQLRAHAEKMMKTKLLTRHFQTNTIILEYKSGMIKTRTMLLGTYLFEKKWRKGFFNKSKSIFQGIYEDEFVKTADGWKFKNRKLITDN